MVWIFHNQSHIHQIRVELNHLIKIIIRKIYHVGDLFLYLSRHMSQLTKLPTILKQFYNF